MDRLRFQPHTGRNQARAALGGAAFDAIWSAAQMLTLEQAIAYALAARMETPEMPPSTP